jgi:hypothetical protein
MKINVPLSSRHKRILLVLLKTGPIPFRRFDVFFDTVFGKEDFGGLVHGVAFIAELSEDPALKSSLDNIFPFLGGRGPTALESEIIGLEFAGLVQIKKVTSQKYFIPDFKKIGLMDYDICLTDEGQRVAELLLQGKNPILRLSPSMQNTIFIACAFGHSDVDELFTTELCPVCESLGYKAVRVDINEPSWTITNFIKEGISGAVGVIADLSFARPSVYFEVGFSQGLGLTPLLTCRKDHNRENKNGLKVHFDLEQFKISFWHKNKNGKFVWPKNMSPQFRLPKLIGSDNSEIFEAESKSQ